MLRLVVRHPGGERRPEELSAEIAAAPRPCGTLRLALRRFESELVREALARHAGRPAPAAAELGITRQALWAKSPARARRRGRVAVLSSPPTAEDG